MKKYAISPIDGEDITKGKEYDVINISSISGFTIKDDDGIEIYCISENKEGLMCGHLGFKKSWKIIEK